MRVFKPGKSGFTLVEVLVVVAIMGILSSMGVVSLRSAVINTRIKDAGINVTAFMERVANESRRLNDKLCVTVDNSYKVFSMYKGDCSGSTPPSASDAIDRMSLESQNKVILTGCNCPDGVSGFSNGVAVFTPRLGLSAAPTGCVIVRYGETDRYAAIVKSNTRNSVYYKLSYDGCQTWSEF